MSISNRIQNSAIDFLAAALIAALVVAVPSPAYAQQKSAAQQPAAKPAMQTEQADEAPAAQKPGQEGIKVHGHWLIDVKDSDGKLVQHRDFENALQLYGSVAMFTLLSGQYVPEHIGVELDTTTSIKFFIYPSASTGLAGYCNNSSNGFTSCYNNETRMAAGGGIPTGLTLSGQIPAQAGPYTLNGVQTVLGICGGTQGPIVTTTISPASCISSNTSYSTLPFTGTTVTPLSVAAGQIVSVSVTISFS